MDEKLIKKKINRNAIEDLKLSILNEIEQSSYKN